MSRQAQQGRQRPLRADAERTVRAILEAAERVLSANPAATMEQIAEAAGVARTTVHRRFATREALVEALTAWATRQFHEAVTAARPDSTPPLVALYQVTANVLRVKIGWGFAMSRTAPEDPEVARVHADVLDRCARLFQQAQEAGVLRPDTDLEWVRRVYYALIHEATQARRYRVDDGGGAGGADRAEEADDTDHVDDTDDTDDVDELATLVVDALLRGFGASGGALAS